VKFLIFKRSVYLVTGAADDMIMHVMKFLKLGVSLPVKGVLNILICGRTSMRLTRMNFVPYSLYRKPGPDRLILVKFPLNSVAIVTRLTLQDEQDVHGVIALPFSFLHLQEIG